MHTALIAIVTLFITACGLQGDLYLPPEKPATAPGEPQSPDAETTEDSTTDPSSEPTP